MVNPTTALCDHDQSMMMMIWTSVPDMKEGTQWGWELHAYDRFAPMILQEGSQILMCFNRSIPYSVCVASHSVFFTLIIAGLLEKLN